MRIGGFAGKVLAKLGVVPQQIAGGDIYPALEKGTIDAAEWVGPYDDEKLGFYKVAPYYYYPGYWEGGPALHRVLQQARNGPSCRKIYQAIAVNAAHHGNTYMQARYDALNPGGVKKLVAQGAQLRPFSPEILEASLQGGAARSMPRPRPERRLQEDLRPRDAVPRRAYLWWQVAEYSFDSFSIRMRAKA